MTLPFPITESQKLPTEDTSIKLEHEPQQLLIQPVLHRASCLFGSEFNPEKWLCHTDRGKTGPFKFTVTESPDSVQGIHR